MASQLDPSSSPTSVDQLDECISSLTFHGLKDLMHSIKNLRESSTPVLFGIQDLQFPAKEVYSRVIQEFNTSMEKFTGPLDHRAEISAAGTHDLMLPVDELLNSIFSPQKPSKLHSKDISGELMINLPPKPCMHARQETVSRNATLIKQCQDQTEVNPSSCEMPFKETQKAETEKHRITESPKQESSLNVTRTEKTQTINKLQFCLEETAVNSSPCKVPFKCRLKRSTSADSFFPNYIQSGSGYDSPKATSATRYSALQEKNDNMDYDADEAKKRLPFQPCNALDDFPCQNKDNIQALLKGLRDSSISFGKLGYCQMDSLFSSDYSDSDDTNAISEAEEDCYDVVQPDEDSLNLLFEGLKKSRKDTESLADNRSSAANKGNKADMGLSRTSLVFPKQVETVLSTFQTVAELQCPDKRMDFEQELMAEKTTPNCDEYFADEDEDPTEESGHVRYLPRSLNDTSSRELKHESLFNQEVVMSNACPKKRRNQDSYEVHHSKKLAARDERAPKQTKQQGKLQISSSSEEDEFSNSEGNQSGHETRKTETSKACTKKRWITESPKKKFHRLSDDRDELPSALKFNVTKLAIKRKKKKYTCQVCGKNLNSNLKRHQLAKHSKIKPVYPCPLENCSKEYQTKFNLTEHIKGYHEGGFACPADSCQKTFITGSAARKHARKYHSLTLTGAPSKELYVGTEKTKDQSGTDDGSDTSETEDS